MKNRAIFLTDGCKKLFNRDTYITFPSMGLNRIGSGLLAATVAAMSPSANAQETTETAQTTETAVADASAETGQLSLAVCRAKETRDDVRTCLVALREQQEAEIAARTERVAAQSTEIATLDETIDEQNETIATEQEGLAQDNTTLAVLTESNDQLERRVEGLRQLRDITAEEIERDPSSD